MLHQEKHFFLNDDQHTADKEEEAHIEFTPDVNRNEQNVDVEEVIHNQDEYQLDVYGAGAVVHNGENENQYNLEEVQRDEEKIEQEDNQVNIFIDRADDQGLVIGENNEQQAQSNSNPLDDSLVFEDKVDAQTIIKRKQEEVKIVHPLKIAGLDNLKSGFAKMFAKKVASTG